VDQLVEWLQGQGVKTLPYHAGLDDRTRARNQEAFARDEVHVVVATVAFGMGIDKSNVRFVIHREMPRSIEAWYQELGRAGRDGLSSDIVTFYSWKDVADYEFFLAEIEDAELRTVTRARTRDLFRLLDRSDGCRHQGLVRYFDEQIEPCGTSCDHCLGIGIEALLPAGAAGAVRAPRGEASADPELFERLRQRRRDIADLEGVPPYIVFSDAVLHGMVKRMPRTHAELLDVAGIGPVKAERYGALFLKVLRGEQD
jgi:ATP-dependent DNA helicase RecQ